MIKSVLANRIVLVLSLIGIGVAGYLTLAHAMEMEVGCGASRGCAEVAAHYTAKGFGIPFLKSIPTAAFGLMMYIAMTALAFVRAAASETLARRAGLLQWLLAAGSLLVSGWLTYLEAYVIGAWCKWCVGSAIIVLLLFLTTTAERLRARRGGSMGGAATHPQGESL